MAFVYTNPYDMTIVDAHLFFPTIQTIIVWSEIVLQKKVFRYICYLPDGRSVLEKYFVEVSKTVRDRRPRDVFETETKYFSSTDRPKR